MKDLTVVQHCFLPRVFIIITICCRKRRAIVMVQPVSSCPVISVHFKSVVVPFIIDVKITKNQHKVLLWSSCINLYVCGAATTIVFSNIPGWLA